MIKDEDEQKLIDKKTGLIMAIAEVVAEVVEKSGKSGRKISAEYEIGLGVLSKLIRGKSDIKYTTLWKLANALQINPIEMTRMITEKLPENFNFFE